MNKYIERFGIDSIAIFILMMMFSFTLIKLIDNKSKKKIVELNSIKNLNIQLHYERN